MNYALLTLKYYLKLMKKYINILRETKLNKYNIQSPNIYLGSFLPMVSIMMVLI